MILPSKDSCFEESLLYNSIILYCKLKDKTHIDLIYDLYSGMNEKDLEIMLLFLYCIKKIDIEGNEVIKI